MANDVFKLNLAGLNELMKSGEMQSILAQAGDAVAGHAGAGYGSRVHEASFVAIANVFPTDEKSAKDNYKNNTLLKALNSTHI